MNRKRLFFAILSAVALSAYLQACALTADAQSTKNNDDARITADVQSALGQHPDLGANQISVETRDHVVYLNGTVYDSLMRANATSVARSVPGVSKVVNNVGIDK